jgi:hypothetical protein
VEGRETWRRSVYVFAKRSIRLPLLEVFDAPDWNTSCARRVPTTAPTQALALMNDGFVREQAGRLAARVTAESPPEASARIAHAYLLALERQPSRSELEAGLKFLGSNATDDKAAALTDFCHVLFTLNEFLYVD